MSKLFEEFIKLGAELSKQQDAASDLWTWLPSHKVAQKYHGDYADSFIPSINHIMTEAAMYISALRDGKWSASPVPFSTEMVDKICFNIGNTHDQSDLWHNMRQNPESFRQAVTMALTKKEPFTAEEQEWFFRCPCGEDHA